MNIAKLAKSEMQNLLLNQNSNSQPANSKRQLSSPSLFSTLQFRSLFPLPQTPCPTPRSLYNGV